MEIFSLGLLEILLVSIGISFDVLAVSVCYGSVLMEIRREQLLKIIGIFTLCQTVGVMLGEMVTLIPLFRENSDRAASLRHACSIIILVAIGAFLLFKSWKQGDILEKREELNLRRVAVSALISSVDALFAGFGFALWAVNQLEVLICVVLTTALAVWLGIKIGYHLGWEPKKNAYYIGASVLLVSAIDVLIRLLTE